MSYPDIVFERLSLLTRSRIESGKRYGNIHENVYQYGYGEPQKKVEIDAE